MNSCTVMRRRRHRHRHDVGVVADQADRREIGHRIERQASRTGTCSPRAAPIAAARCSRPARPWRPRRCRSRWRRRPCSRSPSVAPDRGQLDRRRRGRWRRCRRRAETARRGGQSAWDRPCACAAAVPATARARTRTKARRSAGGRASFPPRAMALWRRLCPGAWRRDPYRMSSLGGVTPDRATGQERSGPGSSSALSPSSSSVSVTGTA